MHTRQAALEVLTRARELLADRLTERVLDGSEDLLEDAAGESFRGEIDALYEQVGSKLTLINQMIANFPVDVPANMDVGADADGNDEQAERAEAVVETGERFAPGMALPSPPATLGIARDTSLDTLLADAQLAIYPRPEPHTFKAFLRQIRARNLMSAAETLAVLLNLPLADAELCASHFMRRLDFDIDFLTEAMQLRLAIAEGTPSDGLMLLRECFALDGQPAANVLAHLLKQQPELDGDQI